MSGRQIIAVSVNSELRSLCYRKRNRSTRSNFNLIPNITELGAKHVGQHAASRAHELTPGLWKERFAANPLRSDLHNVGVGVNLLRVDRLQLISQGNSG
jgi:hypothetical protein